MRETRIGTAGWSVPRDLAAVFPTDGNLLQRYAAGFNAVEINSSFYRSHKPATYARWAADTPADFRFAVKVPRAITHYAKLVGCADLIAAFVDEIAMLGDKLGPLLVQLPPSLAFDAAIAKAFFADLRARFGGDVVCEPRHASWSAAEPEALLAAHRVARAAVDPARHPMAATPGGWPDLAYWRLHGSPRMYYSTYDDDAQRRLVHSLEVSPAMRVWCVFDNTASGAAARNALRLRDLLGR